jgi:hypothetical protein
MGKELVFVFEEIDLENLDEFQNIPMQNLLNLKNLFLLLLLVFPLFMFEK